ncbi:hypothetical protein FDZ58_01295 [Ehrlichia ruminantium]|uniref:Uncharacterized protein n=1 Tax=Ehrlichia ruminantium (strain Welgevonden) TaxID=254945 RepID=A0A0H3LYV1_EHRRW|nr:hypothetical protein [Ehrlichia ruminantium]KYW98712.1 hypothetical protein AUR40_05090 [Ehrlichia ruminantium]QLK53069.1 hypothetical protein FDZ64_01295 [Ehrlichia ruminantium]QLK54907.1 hypothetical protein FDZ62_01320 [Ehrlichia ruminantium]QLK55824.1 hypothetical protein FDZ61_01320 [Ehrlichia ruminantium]QLK58571.1 hypothetical protein FDZ58_01295 [Ehrlichia ruminantium]
MNNLNFLQMWLLAGLACILVGALIAPIIAYVMYRYRMNLCRRDLSGMMNVLDTKLKGESYDDCKVSFYINGVHAKAVFVEKCLYYNDGMAECELVQKHLEYVKNNSNYKKNGDDNNLRRAIAGAALESIIKTADTHGNINMCLIHHFVSYLYSEDYECILRHVMSHLIRKQGTQEIKKHRNGMSIQKVTINYNTEGPSHKLCLRVSLSNSITAEDSECNSGKEESDNLSMEFLVLPTKNNSHVLQYSSRKGIVLTTSSFTKRVLNVPSFLVTGRKELPCIEYDRKSSQEFIDTVVRQMQEKPVGHIR